MVTGVVPFEADSAVSIALMHLQEAVPPADSLHPDIPKSIQYILEKALQKDADKRYPDAIAMMKDLRQAMTHPDGAYIQRSDPAPGDATQVVPVIHTGEIPEQGYPADRRARKQRRFHLALVTAAFVLFIALLFYGAFTAGRVIYRNYFEAQDVPVPPVEGLSATTAEARLRDAGLALDIRGSRHDREVPEGVILSQDPQPGIRVRAGSTVGVIVSQGIRTVTVPNVTGKSQRDAEVELENQGLRVGEPIYAFSEYPSGRVSAQSIDPEREVQENTLITLTISRGPEETRVLVGRYTELMEQTAKARILEDGLTVGTVHREHHDAEAGTVYRHHPPHGVYAEYDRPVELWVSLGPQPPRTRILRIDYEGPETRIHLRVVRASDDAVIHDQYHMVTEDPIEVEVEGRGAEQYLIYVNGHYMIKHDINFDRSGT
jgi:serine/threonine-protein kinase